MRLSGNPLKNIPALAAMQIDSAVCGHTVSQQPASLSDILFFVSMQKQNCHKIVLVSPISTTATFLLADEGRDD